MLVPTRQTRAADGPTIYLPIPSTEIYEKSIFYYGASLWINLPLNIRIQDNLESFKTMLYKNML